MSLGPRLRRVVAWGAVALAVQALGAPSPEAAMRAAIDDLHGLSSYSWRRWSERPTQAQFDAAHDAGYRGVGAPVAQVMTGKTDREGVNIWTADARGVKVRGIFHGRQGVVNFGQGWQSWEELRFGPPPRGKPRDAVEEKERLAQAVARSLVRVGFISPGEQLRSVAAAGMVGFYRVGDMIAAELDPDGARQVLLLEGAENIWSLSGVTAKNAHGSVKVWLKDEHLVRFEVHIEGIITARSPDGFSSNINHTKITTFADFGAAEFSIPPEAREALNQTREAGEKTPARPEWRRRFDSYSSNSAARP